MNLKINTKEWRLSNDDNGANKLIGEYSVYCGKEEVASKSFNNGYGNINIPFSPELMIKLNDIDSLIKTEIENYFKGE